MALDESFKRPGSVPFKWEVQPGIPKHDPAADVVPPTPTQRLALPPATRARAVVGAAPCRRTSSWAAAEPLKAPLPSHQRSMSARFATSLALMPFTRRSRRGERAASKDDADAEFCLLYADNNIA